MRTQSHDSTSVNGPTLALSVLSWILSGSRGAGQAYRSNRFLQTFVIDRAGAIGSSAAWMTAKIAIAVHGSRFTGRRSFGEEVRLSQLFSHQQSHAETSLDRSDLFEAAGNVKLLGMRIPDYMQPF